MCWGMEPSTRLPKRSRSKRLSATIDYAATMASDYQATIAGYIAIANLGKNRRKIHQKVWQKTAREPCRNGSAPRAASFYAKR